jgi:hypothetical protein
LINWGGKLKKFARRLALTITAAAAVVAGLAAPAHAATNPYTAASACANDFGGSWFVVSDGHRAIVHNGVTIGDVYLTYNSATGYNCAVTIKRKYVGTATGTGVNLWVQGVADVAAYQDGSYKYYAAVKYHAAGRCVDYEGLMDDPGTVFAGRYYWGNCG